VVASTTQFELALELIRPGDVIGLGTGRAAQAFLVELARKVHEGLEIRGVATSQRTEALARTLGIPLIELDEVETVDLTVDGADEIAPNLDLIKGLGGALIREKMVAAASRRFVVVAGPGKEFDRLGGRGVLPVEVVPFAVEHLRRRLLKMGFDSRPRMAKVGAEWFRRGLEGLFLTDNGNPLLEVAVTPDQLANPHEVQRQLHDLPGVVGTGLFLGMAQVALIGPNPVDSQESSAEIARVPSPDFANNYPLRILTAPGVDWDQFRARP
jgi:ribose 5-phosphate isomerase A